MKRKSGSHSVGIHGSGPRGPVRAPVFTDKASPAGPRHTHTERGATEGEEHRRGGDKVTRGEKMEKGREGAMGEGLCGSSHSPKNAGVMGCHLTLDQSKPALL